MVSGSCLCGALRYEVDGPFENLMHCHCSMCRKHHGASFATFVGAPARGFRWLAGEHSVQRYESSPGGFRAFCGTCGSVAPGAMGDSVYMPAGNLEGELGNAGGMHIFVGSKAPWHNITDALPQHETLPPGWPEPQSKPVASSASSEPFGEPNCVDGGCLCGEVRFRVRGAPAFMRNCHCSRCRRARSAAFATNLGYLPEQFTWLAGETLVRRYKIPEANRFTNAFCSRCGGEAPSAWPNIPFIVVPAGTLDDDPGMRPQQHIHVAAKASWHSFVDDLPQFAGPPS